MQNLRVVLYDHDTLDKDDEIGDAKLAVKDLKDQEEKDIWLDIKEMHPDKTAEYKVRGYLFRLGSWCTCSNINRPGPDTTALQAYTSY